MSIPSTARGHGIAVDGAGINGSKASLLGHRQSNLSRTSLLPSDSISQSGGMGGSRNTTSKVLHCFIVDGILTVSDRYPKSLHQSA
jgi:hypothetical protein